MYSTNCHYCQFCCQTFAHRLHTKSQKPSPTSLRSDIPQSDKSFLEVFYETYDDVILFCKSIAEDCKSRKPNGQISCSACLSELLSTMEGDFFHNKLRKALKSHFLDTVGYFVVHDGIYVDPVATDSTHDIMKRLAKEQFGAGDLFSL